jgi:hypothetical protein
VPRKTFVAGEILTALDVNTNLMDQAVMTFADATERDAEIPSPVEGMVVYRRDADVYEGWNGSAWVNVSSIGAAGYRFVSTVYFTSNGTFSKADYPWLRAIRIQTVGAGAGGGGATQPNNAGAGGGGGGYAERFFTDIASLGSSVSVTVGSAGGGGAAGNNTGTGGGASEFGGSGDAWRTRATGGSGGGAGNSGSGGAGGTGTDGQLLIPGGTGGSTSFGGTFTGASGYGGSSVLGQTSRGAASGVNSVGVVGNLYGGGGSGAMAVNLNQAGSAGANGIVIVELYA